MWVFGRSVCIMRVHKIIVSSNIQTTANETCFSSWGLLATKDDKKDEPEYLARQNCPKQKIWNSRMTCTTKLETAKMFYCPTHQPTHVGQTVFSVHLVLQYMYCISKTEINKMLDISSRWSLYWHMHFSATVSLYVIINQLINLDMRWKDNELL